MEREDQISRLPPNRKRLHAEEAETGQGEAPPSAQSGYDSLPKERRRRPDS